MAAARLFTALVPPAVVRTELADLATALAGVRWTPAENLHLTLRFIGESDDDKTGRYLEALARVRVEPFLLPVGGAGVFPTRGAAKVIWTGVGRGHTRLHQLRQRVDEALLAVDAGLAMTSFHPHFTLGRLDAQHDGKAVGRYVTRHQEFEAPPFRVEEFHLLASELRPGRPPAYRVVRSFSLMG